MDENIDCVNAKIMGPFPYQTPRLNPTAPPATPATNKIHCRENRKSFYSSSRGLPRASIHRRCRETCLNKRCNHHF